MEFETLKGKTLTAIKVNDAKDVIMFITSDGEVFKSFHDQDCCESVIIQDINGDLQDLIGHPLEQAEETTNSKENPEGYDDQWQESFTWTFYKLATVKGYVTIRWLGESNGYYGEGVDFRKQDDDGNFPYS